MAQTNQNFDIYAGDTVDITVTLTDAAGASLDLTGLTLWFGVGDVVKTSADPAQIEVDPAIVIHLLPEDTVGMEGGYKHQLRGIDTSGRVETFATGTVRVAASVFQPTLAVVTPQFRLVGESPWPIERISHRA
jgi:hypothetical protein